ncbi:hypothetical protein F2Q69_00044579 [Brassica cretica]|uniref:Arabidopsis retrotransposon Orf1 C-terminal domain-containing protein n=1 Tax=Brassica cretica TaxID=69181 RepID=A0A8S9NGU5_BRACR|nr:hypothetical protein F2Q69_00044579 [Brassica cretica]
MKKVAAVLTRGGIAGCSSADFAFENTSVPQPPPQPTDLGFPLTDRQLQQKWRNPPTQPSTSGNKSPSLASSESEAEIEEVQSQQCNDIYASFGMVSFFVNRLEHYRDWAWYTTDSQPKVGIGGMITLLLQFLNVPLGKDAAGPKFIDGTYLRIATYFSGMYGKDYVYHHYLQGKPVEVVSRPIAAPRKRSVPTRHDFTEPPREESVPIYGPPHYYFKPHNGVLPPGVLRDAHDHIGRLQRWNKAQNRTIEKLKDKCKALSKTVKKQAKTSAKFMKKPPPQATDLGFPLTDRQLQRQWRNPPTQPSASGNKSPSLASSESEAEIENVQSQQWYRDYSSGHGANYNLV